MSSGKEPEEYVRKIQEDTRRYVESLLKETERLRLLVRTIAAEKEQLHREVDELRGRLLRQEQSHSELRRVLDDIQRESEQHAQDFALVEQQHNDLATLYIASYRLHGTLKHDEVLATIKEIITNLVGSEQVAVFELSDDASKLKLVSSTGVSPEAVGDLDLNTHMVGRIARRGQIYLRGDDPELDREAEPSGLTAVIPMTVGADLVGAVTVYKLLQQKAGWADVDHQLFEMLGTQAAVALHTTGLIEERR